MKALADANRLNSEELTRCKEAQSLELTRIKEAAKAELDASLAEAKAAREEASRTKQMTNIHAERDQNDLQTARSKLEALKGLTKKVVEESNQRSVSVNERPKCLFAEFSTRFSDLQIVFQDLKRKYDATHSTLQTVTHEVKDVRKTAINGLKGGLSSPTCDGPFVDFRLPSSDAAFTRWRRDVG